MAEAKLPFFAVGLGSQDKQQEDLAIKIANYQAATGKAYLIFFPAKLKDE